MTRPSPIPEALGSTPFTRADALRLISPDDLRGPSYQRVLRGVHRRAGDLTHGDRIVAALHVLPSDTVLGGRSALWSMGVPMADAETPLR